MDVARLLVQVEANTAQAEAGLASLHKQVALAAIGFGVLVVAGAAAGIVAVKMAGDFQKGLATLVTGAGESSKNIKMVHDGILQLAQSTGTSTKQLIDGMFMIESAGYHGAAGLDILKAAAEGAKVGNADLGTVADAVTTIMKDYPNVMNGAAGATNYLVATVANGKTHMQDLADSLSMVLPTAAAAGIGLNSVMAAMATMTGEGTRAANASTYLRQTIISLTAPGAGAKKMLEEVGLSAQDVATMLQDPNVGLAGALAKITEAVGKKFPVGSAAYFEAIKTIAGGSKVMQGMVQLTGVHLKDFQANMVAVTGAVKDSGKTIAGWSYIQNDFNFQMSKMREMLEVAFISLGEHLLPALTSAVKFIVEKAGPAVAGLTKFFSEHKAILVIVAALIIGPLAAAFTVWAATALAAAAGTMAANAGLLLIGAGLALLVAGIIYAYTHWGWFRDAVHHAADAVKVMVHVLGTLLAILGAIKDSIGELLGKLGHLKDMAGNVLGGIGNAIHSIHIPGFAGGTGYAPGGAAMLAEGGGPELVMRPGIYNLPRGSTVLDAQDTAKVLSGSGQKSQTINIYPQKADLDSDDLARHLRRMALLASPSGGY